MKSRTIKTSGSCTAGEVSPQIFVELLPLFRRKLRHAGRRKLFGCERLLHPGKIFGLFSGGLLGLRYRSGQDQGESQSCKAAVSESAERKKVHFNH